MLNFQIKKINSYSAAIVVESLSNLGRFSNHFDIFHKSIFPLQKKKNSRFIERVESMTEKLRLKVLTDIFLIVI